MPNLQSVMTEKANEIPPDSSIFTSRRTLLQNNEQELYLIGVRYHGGKGLAYLQLYDPITHKVITWFDNTNHKPYCFSKERFENIQQDKSIVNHPGFEKLEQVKKYDALKDEEIGLTKIIAKDPLSIGGRPSGSMRDQIKAWEADIKYVENYIYDRQLLPGMPYIKEGEKLQLKGYRLPREIDNFIKTNIQEQEYIKLSQEWMKLLECPVPDYLRAALDIEVYSEVTTRIPDPREAVNPIICVSIVGTDESRVVLVLEREEIPKEPIADSIDAQAQFFNDEKQLIAKIFEILQTYPVLITFNGDDFDLRYLYHRAERLGFKQKEIPIELTRDSAIITHGIHIDLYRFFFNRSIQIYAFSQKYRENTLDSVSSAIIGEKKLEIDKPISELNYSELAAYCLRDADITFKLTTFKKDLVMKIITILSRISYMSLEDVSRTGVSNWIRSMLFREHRKRGMLIPRSDDILELKDVTTTTAIIKGKKYKGAIVVEPVPGIHFSVDVLDFASLYPSIINNWNLGYETVLCPHESSRCRENHVPETTLWVCKKNKALESLLIGSLRDLRVRWYKPKSKDESLHQEVRDLYSVVQNALKVVLNASYGVFGAETFALYCPPVAEATASIGRYIITKSIEKANSIGVKVIYGDTDSIFLGNPSQTQLKELIKWSQEELGMMLEIDKHYRFVALSSRKKNYLGVFPEGTVDIKGLTGKKRHVPVFLKEAFYDMIKILSNVRSPQDFDTAKDKVEGIVRNCYQQVKKRQIPLEKLAFNIMISKKLESYTKTTPQHVKAAKLLEDNGREIKPGDIISYVKVLGDTGVKPVQIAHINEIDLKKYIEYISSTFEQVLDAIGTSFEELTGGRKLNSFF